MFAARKGGGGFFLGFTSGSSIRIFFQTESYRPAASSNILDEVMVLAMKRGITQCFSIRFQNINLVAPENL